MVFFHCEIRFNKDLLPVLVEIAFRLPGDKIVDLIKLSSNIDLSKAMLLSYAGLPYVTEVFKNKMFAGVAFIMIKLTYRIIDIEKDMRLL